MSWTDLVPWLAQTGVVGLIAAVAYRLHRDAVAAERRRADDWRIAAQRAEARADLRETQLHAILGVVQRTTEGAT